jgi:hypothetical protein
VPNSVFEEHAGSKVSGVSKHLHVFCLLGMCCCVCLPIHSSCRVALPN